MSKFVFKSIFYVVLAVGILAMLHIGFEYFIFPVNTSFMRTKYNLLHNSVWHVALFPVRFVFGHTIPIVKINPLKE